MIAKPLQHIADIADQGSRRRIDGDPAAIVILDLKSGFVGSQQQRDDIDVLVRPGANVRTILRRRRIVKKAQDRIAQVHRWIEEIAAEAKVDGDGLQDLQAHGVQGVVQPLHLFLELGQLGVGPDVVGHVVAEPVARREVAADVPELLQVVVDVALGGFHAEGRVSALALNRQPVFQLGRL